MFKFLRRSDPKRQELDRRERKAAMKEMSRKRRKLDALITEELERAMERRRAKPE